MTIDWSGPNLPSYVDPFSVSAGAGQQGGSIASGQMGGYTAKAQMGDSHPCARVPGGTPLNVAWTGTSKQHSGPQVSKQMGDGYSSTQQMG